MKETPDGPPRLAARIMVLMLMRRRDRVARSLDEQRQFAESVAGDMEEVYFSMAESHGHHSARRWYWRETRRTMIPSLNYQIGVALSMFLSHLKISFRHLWKTRVYTTINVGGLGIALGVAVIALLYARNELSYDQFHPGHEEIYRIGTSIFFEKLEVWENTPFPLADAIQSEAPGIEAVARLTLLRAKGVETESTREEADIHLASSELLSMLHFPLQDGSPILGPGTVVLGSSAADRLFPGGGSLGAEVRLELKNEEWQSFRVTGIFEPTRANSSINFDYLVSEQVYADVFGPGSETDWRPKSATATFVRLSAGADPSVVGAALDDIGRTNNVDEFLAGLEVDHVLPMEALAEAHFSRLITNRILGPNGDSMSVMVMVAIALLLLTIACVNFVNLSLGLSTSRVREVGVRKVFGANRGQLARQYAVEAMVVSMFALLVGIGIAYLLLPSFNSLMGQDLRISLLAEYRVAGVLTTLGLVVGLLAGSYPSLYLSRFSPNQVLKAKFRLVGRHPVGRAMVGFQFAVSIFLIAAAITASKQLALMTQMDLGFNQELVILQKSRRGFSQETIDLYREQLMQDPHVQGVSGARATMLGDGIDSALMVELDGEPYPLAANKIDGHFLDVLELDLAAGRNLSTIRPTDATGAVLVNEAFARVFQVDVGDATPFDVTREGAPTIVGIVADYHFMSLRREIEPVVLYLRPESSYRQILTRVTGNDLTATLAMMRQTWADLQTGTLFSYTFLDDALQDQYVSEAQSRRVGTLGALVSLAIAIAGLLGMTSLSVAQRSNEIGVRKVLGATSPRIVLLFNAEYAPIFLVSSMVAIPVSYLAMDRWLEQFAYRVSVEPVVLAGAAVLVAGIAAATISLECFRSAVRNPVDAIRYE